MSECIKKRSLLDTHEAPRGDLGCSLVRIYLRRESRAMRLAALGKCHMSGEDAIRLYALWVSLFPTTARSSLRSVAIGRDLPNLLCSSFSSPFFFRVQMEWYLIDSKAGLTGIKAERGKADSCVVVEERRKTFLQGEEERLRGLTTGWSDRYVFGFQVDGNR